MRVAIQKDSTDDLDIVGVAAALNAACKGVSFTTTSDRTRDTFTRPIVTFEDEKERLAELRTHAASDLILYVTDRQYGDNYFYHATEDVGVLSLFAWSHLTPLPRENGLVFFLARFIADSVIDLVSHGQPIGCLNDKLWVKTDIDRCLKQAYLCASCITQLDHAAATADEKRVLADVNVILDLISNASRWGRAVSEAAKDADTRLDWQGFEQFVADYYRSLGADVRQDANLAGFQVDVVATERTASGEAVRTAVECKFHRDKLGNRAVNEVIRVMATIRDAGLIDRGVLVSYAGFTPDAQLAADHAHLKLITYADLRQRISNESTTIEPHRSVPETVVSPEQAAASAGDTPKETVDVFVIMPFSADLDDVYFFGIHQAVQELGLTCARVDQIVFTGSVVDEIYHQLAHASLIIAELTQPNINVYYELGIAHALQRPVVLLTNNVASAPFDLKVTNHLVYANIRDLRSKLLERVKALLVR